MIKGEVSASSLSRRSVTSSLNLVVAIAWRNLGRNRRRTWLVAGAIAFAIFLTVFFMSLQAGTYVVATENATAFLTGHVQVQARGYFEDPRIETTLSNSSALIEKISGVAGIVEISARAQTYVLASAGERSTGAQLVGVDPEVEPKLSSLSAFVKHGQYLSGYAEQAYVGSVLARNLDLKVGDELVLLGSQKRGGIATLVLNIVGIFTTGQVEVDRALIQVPLPVFQEAFALDNESHMLVIKTDDVSHSYELSRTLGAIFPELNIQDWTLLLPELEQAIAVDRTSGKLFYGMLLVMVIFSVVNTFIMMVFERTREFGVLLSLGMRPWPIIALLQLEAFWLCLLGVFGGLIIACIMVISLGKFGIPLGDNAEIMKAFHLPDRIYPALSSDALLASPVLMLVAIQVAAFISSVRILKINPVQAMRAR